VLRREHVRRVLADTPEPFATETAEKRAALAHFEPKGVLISHGADRADRRRFNEEALDSGRPVHRLGDTFAAIVADEVARSFLDAARPSELSWNRFADTWFRIVRLVVFGEGAREDPELSHVMARLRSHANWAWLWPKQPAMRRRLFDRLNAHLARADPASLAGVIAATRVTSRTAPTQQVPQWLFAFDAAGLATFRALALLATHPRECDRARHELDIANQAPRPHELPYLRACVLESVRLWPTSPLVLRETAEQTVWGRAIMEARTTVTIYAPFFHRDGRTVPFADRFTPDVWLEQGADQWAFVPFSQGPGTCPGRDLVLLLASTMLAALIDGRDVQLMAPHPIRAGRPLPGTLNPYSLRFRLPAHVTGHP
jgi:cytochrome P450